MTILDRAVAEHSLRILPTRVLDVAYTPDSDDIFNFYAWEHHHVRLPGWRARFHRDHISSLNRAALAERYNVVNVSSVIFPQLADRYWILATGSSVGRGYGPMLVSRNFQHVDQLRGRRIAIAGPLTTGGTLAAMYCPEATFVTLPYDRIADTILEGAVDAGVMIHEELVHFPQRGLRLVLNLGAAWLQETGLPLPVGLNLVSRRLGREAATQIQATCRRSLEWALRHPDRAMAYASTFGRGCAQSFVPMFSNDDTRCLAQDARQALGVLFARLEERGAPRAPADWEIIDA